jgi:hypothetical protein
MIEITDFIDSLPRSFLIGLAVWELVWKGFGLWKAGRKNQPVWFFLIFVLNTAGLLPIVYLFLSKDKRKGIEEIVPKKAVKKKVIKKRK